MHDIVTSMWHIQVPILEKVLRTLLVYLVILLLLRLAGKRELAQLNSFDLVVLLLLSNVVQNAVIGPDDSVTGGLIGAAVLLGFNAVIVRAVARSRAATALFEGTPTTLIDDGRLDEGALRHLGLRRAEVIKALHRQGADTVEEVASATLDPGGAIVVELKESERFATKEDVRRLEAKLDRLLDG
ncbi:MAG: YetF domain-containing protein [Actinomycetota bacterium]